MLQIDLSKFQFHKKGKRFEDDYKSMDKINEGAFGQVRCCKLKRTGDKRAVKILAKSNLSQEHVEEFQNEINLLSEVQHPNIIKVYGSYEDNRYYYIVTDLYQGGELFDFIAGDDISEFENMKEGDIADLMKQLLTAVNVCHSKNIMHRDIKPENIMLHKTKKGDPKKIFLIDFGTGIKFKKGKKETSYAGTAYYVAPEMTNGEYDEKIDLWACGMICHLLLVQELPFGLMEQEDEDDIVQIIQKKPVFEIDAEKFANVSDNAKDFISKLLKCDPSERLSASEALKHPWFESSGAAKNVVSMKSLKNIQKLSGNNKMKNAVLHYITVNQVSLETR